MLTPPVHLGIIGWPVTHSYSPVMQGAALRVLGLPWQYAAFAVDPRRSLKEAVLGARALGLRGLNITMPWKEQALHLCRPDELARRSGAVNTLLLQPPDGEEIWGTNTDIHGFLALCREAGAELLPGLRAILLGAGGAARAALVALGGAGAHYSVAGRSARNRQNLLVGGDAVPVLPLDCRTLAPLLPTCDLLVDCTPRGLFPDGAGLAQTHPELDLSLLPAHAVVLDLVVRPRTVLSSAAADRGLRAHTGGAMLLHQGIRALEFWLGHPLPEEARAAMAAALAAALATRPAP